MDAKTHPLLPGAPGPARLETFFPLLMRAGLLAICLVLPTAAQAGQVNRAAQAGQNPGGDHPPATAAATGDQSFMDDLFMAQEWQAAGNLGAARLSLKDALAKQPGDAFTRIRLAQIDAAAGNMAAAADALARVLRDDPDNLLALAWQGHLLMALDQPDQAAASYDRILTLDPANGWALLGSAVCRLSLGRDKEAAGFLAKAQAAAGSAAVQDPELHLALGDAFARLHLPVNARLELERAQELDPRGVRALVLAGEVYARLGNLGLAQNAWSQALGLDKASVQARVDMLAVLGLQAGRALASGNRNEAERLWRAMLAYDPGDQQARANLRPPPKASKQAAGAPPGPAQSASKASATSADKNRTSLPSP